jgi:glycine/D-amino acid oxidase-like deaminating enzyme
MLSASVFQEIAKNNPESGVFQSRCLYLGRSPMQSNPFSDQHKGLNFRHTPAILEDEPSAAAVVAKNTYVDCQANDTIIIETRKYLPWLQNHIERLGATIKRVKINLWTDIALHFNSIGRSFVLVNCTGLGSTALFKDKHEIIPVRGQIVIIRASQVKLSYMDDNHSYVIPSRDGLLECGGTHEEGKTSRTPDPSTTRAILDRCSMMIPSLEDVDVVDEYVCLRPFRKGGVRVELEWIPCGVDRKMVPVVHNYGHGGAGYTLSWGIAPEVVSLVQQACNGMSPTVAHRTCKL